MSVAHSIVFLVAAHSKGLRPTARLPLDHYCVRDIDDGYAEHGADVVVRTQQGCVLVYVGRQGPDVGDARCAAIAAHRGFAQIFLADAEPWRWREARALTARGDVTAARLNALIERGRMLWPDGLQDAVYLRPSDRLLQPPGC